MCDEEGLRVLGGGTGEASTHQAVAKGRDLHHRVHRRHSAEDVGSDSPIAGAHRDPVADSRCGILDSMWIGSSIARIRTLPVVHAAQNPAPRYTEFDGLPLPTILVSESCQGGSSIHVLLRFCHARRHAQVIYLTTCDV